jgi:hypothetical protein
MSRALIAPLLIKTYVLGFVYQVGKWTRQRRSEDGRRGGMSFPPTRSERVLLGFQKARVQVRCRVSLENWREHKCPSHYKIDSLANRYAVSDSEQKCNHHMRYMNDGKID